jgi:hypothetical protein
MFAAVPLKNVPGYSWKDRLSANPFANQDDPLANYTKATFVYYLNSVFQLHTVYGVVAATLTKVDDLAEARGGECFSLLFRGGSRALPQGTYTVEHPSLGKFPLFLVPAGTDSNGAQGYLATINRLSYNDAAAPAPASPKRAWIIQMEDSSAPTNTTPSVKTPAQPAAPAITKPEPKSKPVKKIKKPSWKRTDEDDFDNY